MLLYEVDGAVVDLYRLILSHTYCIHELSHRLQAISTRRTPSQAGRELGLGRSAHPSLKHHLFKYNKPFGNCLCFKLGAGPAP